MTRTCAAHRRGFTLIEILVVVVIIGLAAAVVMPQVSSRDDLKTMAAARYIMSDLIYAQNLSISQQKYHYVRFDDATESYEILSSIDPTAIRITHPVERTPFYVQLGGPGKSGTQGVRIEKAGFDDFVTIAFDELGTPFSYDPIAKTLTPMTEGWVVLKCGTFQMTVNVEPFSGELNATPG